jgi:hypothetical protein
MTRLVSLDLDTPQAEVLERIWHELRRRHAEERGPTLIEDVERAIASATAAGRLAPRDAAELRIELSERAAPDVLRCWWRDLIQDGPALGYYRGDR